jgi:hypothetical protein
MMGIPMDILRRNKQAFPSSLPEFQQIFPDDAVCVAYWGHFSTPATRFDP